MESWLVVQFHLLAEMVEDVLLTVQVLYLSLVELHFTLEVVLVFVFVYQ